MQKLALISAFLLIVVALPVAGTPERKAFSLGGYELSAAKDGELIVDFEQGIIEAKGDARLTTSTGSLHAERIHAQMTKSAAKPKSKTKANMELESATAEGSVKMAMIDQKSGRKIDSSSEKVVYTHAERKAQLTGNVSVVLTDKKQAQPSKLAGDSATVQMDANGASVLDAAGNARLSSAQGDLQADKIHAEVGAVSRQLDSATAEGNVHARVEQDAERQVDATCSRAVILSKENKAVLTGDVSIVVKDPSYPEPARLTGDNATVYLGSSRRIVMGRGSSQTQTQIPLKPKSSTKSK